jgi:hypothetical protein
LLAGSPAIDAGSPDCPPPATDQRGGVRPQGAACDIGAFESGATPPGAADCLCEVKNIFPGGTVANLSLGGKPNMSKAIGVEINAVDAVEGSSLCPDDPLGPYVTAEAVVTFHVEDESGNVILDRTKTVECVSGLDNPTKFVVVFGPENCGPGGGNVGTFNIFTDVTSAEAGDASRTQRIRCRN